MIYKLPTRAARKYRGKHPNAIHSISLTGRDVDGAKCVHIETNSGERLTASYDCLDMPAVNEASRYVGIHFGTFLRLGTIVEMSQERYDAWLEKLREQRKLTTPGLYREG